MLFIDWVYIAVLYCLWVFSLMNVRGRGPFGIIHLIFAFGCLWEDCGISFLFMLVIPMGVRIGSL